jgi:hypothetical protein
LSAPAVDSLDTRQPVDAAVRAVPGEELVDGQAESGTVLRGRVRFRLGKPDRGIGSARVAPALVV